MKIDSIAASAVSVVTIAGTSALMAPTSLMMIHNPASIAIGDTEKMQKAIAMLDEVKVFTFSRRAVTNSLMNKLMPQSAPKAEQKKQDAPTGVSIEGAIQKLQARKYI